MLTIEKALAQIVPKTVNASEKWYDEHEVSAQF